jgi:Flp pilus assembly protein TadG
MLYTKNIKKFIKDTTGNILIIFAIAISSLLAAALFAADYSKIVTAEHELQATADNIALYLGTYSIKYDKSNLQKVGEDRLNMLIKNRKTTGNPYLRCRRRY